MAQSKRPVMIYDGDCGFCKRWIARWKKLTGDRVEYFSFQEAASRYPDIPLEEMQRSVQFLDEEGKRYSGAHAVFRSLSLKSSYRWILYAYSNLPPFAAAAELCYRFVAEHRILFSRLTRIFFPEQSAENSYGVSRWIFLRGLGLIYFIAFASLLPQVRGLIGSQGILPAEAFLDAAAARFGSEGFLILPTFAWFSAADGFLEALCIAGMVAAVLLMLGIAAPLALIFLWADYLSFVSISREFLSFQWDVLLLEAGFLAILFAPWSHSPVTALWKKVPRAAHFLLCWLLFRLMFSSGVVKIASGDAVWRNLSALRYHYETQPLPAWTSWYLHQLPDWFHSISAAGMFAVELVVPFLIFGPRRFRHGAAWSFIVLQLLIMASGNYGFFNLLAVLLCLNLFDDACWPGRIRKRLQSPPFLRISLFKAGNWRGGAVDQVRHCPRFFYLPAVLILLILSLLPVFRLARQQHLLPEPIRNLARLTSPLHLVNHYGLFAVMTTERPEIILEGSHDGVEWQAYEFKYKAGPLSRRPEFVAPHQPRLDWQMWFAALGDVRANLWFVNFSLKLLQGSGDVLELLSVNPFGDRPPRYVRALVYDYRFTNPVQKEQTGNYWHRGESRLYMPAISLPGRQN